MEADVAARCQERQADEAAALPAHLPLAGRAAEHHMDPAGSCSAVGHDPSSHIGPPECHS